MSNLEAITKKPEGANDLVAGACKLHGSFESPALWIGGKLLNESPECPSCAEEARKAQAIRQQDELAERRQRAREQRLCQAGIPVRILEAGKFQPPTENAKAIHATIGDYLKTFDDKFRDGSCLILCGKPGNGKTHLACKLGIELLDRGRSVKYTTATNALRYVRGAYGRNAAYTEHQAITSFTSADLLIIDEVGVKLPSDHDKSILFEIVDERYQQKKPTIVISNLNAAQLEDATDERMIDRLTHNGYLLVFDWESYRGGAS